MIQVPSTYWSSSLSTLTICSKCTRSSSPLYPSLSTSTSTSSIDGYTFFIFPRHSFSGCFGSWFARNKYTTTIPGFNSEHVRLGGIFIVGSFRGALSPTIHLSIPLIALQHQKNLD